MVKTDGELRQHVLDELHWEPFLDASRIGVTVAGGAVRLSGYVKSYPEKCAAKQAAARVRLVRSIIDDIDVRVTDQDRRDDIAIAIAADNVLAWNALIPQGALSLQVDFGWVTLRGEVATCYQKSCAEEALRPLIGVRGITNNIVVKPKGPAGHVQADIAHALERNALVDARDIHVEAEGDRVILRGTVHSWLEREEAQSAASLAPGVSVVENCVEVK